MTKVPIYVAFDMRAPEWGTPRDELYAAAIEMAKFADDIGVQSIGLTEHHGSDDGYLPQPTVLCAAMASVTRSVRFYLSAVLLPLHDPVMVAEQIAVLDLISDGRVSTVFGAGYVPSEFAMFERSLKDRGRLMNAGLELILRALSGERFEMEGRPVFVRPLPLSVPNDIILVGGGVPAAACRAARFDVGFAPLRPELFDIHLQECERLGREPRQRLRLSGPPSAIHLCDDPEAGWKAIEAHAVHVATEYARWAAEEGEASSSPFKGLGEPELLRKSGMFVAWTPDMLIERLPGLLSRGALNFQPLLGGLSPEEGWKSLVLLKDNLPRIEEALAKMNGQATEEQLWTC